MALTFIPDNNGKGFTQILTYNNCEYVNPIENIKMKSFNSTISLERTMILLNKPPFPISLLKNWFIGRAEKVWEKRYQEILNTNYPDNLNILLQTSKKQEQVNLLKNISLTTLGLTSFIFHAYLKFGYSYSKYRTDHHQNRLDESHLPNLINVKDGNVKYSGTTNLTDGQLKNVIEHRKVILATFLDKGNEWHCFFITYKSLDGKENWNNGTPHYHYISSSFGLSREETLKQLQSKNYKLNNLPHIELKDYRK